MVHNLLLSFNPTDREVREGAAWEVSDVLEYPVFLELARSPVADTQIQSKQISRTVTASKILSIQDAEEKYSVLIHSTNIDTELPLHSLCGET